MRDFQSGRRCCGGSSVGVRGDEMVIKSILRMIDVIPLRHSELYYFSGFLVFCSINSFMYPGVRFAGVMMGSLPGM